MAIFNRAVKNCTGATSIEYAVIASMLSIIILGAVLITGQANKDNYTNVTDQVGEAMKDKKPKDGGKE